ncbi:MAG: ornithine carbamoyltransferase [Bacilli bacterium]|nr:ornithine carbamoyltransferase [Bacilli bacterium]
MNMNLSGRNFLKVLDFTTEELQYLIDLAVELKNLKHQGKDHRYLLGKNIACIFEKDSTRTRCSFEVASYDLGMHVTYLGPTGSQMGKKETIKDTARVLGRMFDGIEYRGFEQSKVEELAEYSGVPVWNGLTNEFHPTQMLADFMTMLEHFGHLKGLNLVYFGDARFNTGNSLMIMSAKMGVNFTCCAPKELWPSEELINTAKIIASENNCTITLTEDVNEGAAGKDVVYTDVWVSMGEPDEVWAERINLLTPYRVTTELMNMTSENSIFLHCLPSFHNTDTTIGKDIAEKFGVTEMEVTDEVFESAKSKVFEEAENRMHTIKAVMYATLK